jgi:hypothetical protein
LRSSFSILGNESCPVTQAVVFYSDIRAACRATVMTNNIISVRLH